MCLMAVRMLRQIRRNRTGDNHMKPRPLCGVRSDGLAEYPNTPRQTTGAPYAGRDRLTNKYIPSLPVFARWDFPPRIRRGMSHKSPYNYAPHNPPGNTASLKSSQPVLGSTAANWGCRQQHTQDSGDSTSKYPTRQQEAASIEPKQPCSSWSYADKPFLIAMDGPQLPVYPQ
jgi:hypothetical protein